VAGTCSRGEWRGREWGDHPIGVTECRAISGRLSARVQNYARTDVLDHLTRPRYGLTDIGFKFMIIERLTPIGLVE